MTSVVKTRAIPGVPMPGMYQGVNFGVPFVAHGEADDFTGTQITVSDGHPFHRRKPGRMSGDIGGAFFTQRRYLKSGIIPVMARIPEESGDQFGYSIYSGPTWIHTPSKISEWPNSHVGFPPASLTSDSALNALGATAIAKCQPTNSIADVSTFLGELLKDGLPSIIGAQTWRDRTDLARSAGSEFLNVQFGWLPLVSDITKFTGGVSKASAVLAQYERDAGKVVRRRFNFPLERSTSTTIVGSTNNRQRLSPFKTTYQKGGGRSVQRTRETVRSRWFSGAFTYHLPSGYDSRKTMDKYALLADRLGLTPTPETLWELAPWSWAVDWFSNAGDVVANVSAFTQYGLVMRYGYMMDHTIVTDTYTQDRTGLEPQFGSAPPLVLVTETKVRKQAHPFGFGVSWNGLSPIQTSILAALGLSRK